MLHLKFVILHVRSRLSRCFRRLRQALLLVAVHHRRWSGSKGHALHLVQESNWLSWFVPFYIPTWSSVSMTARPHPSFLLQLGQCPLPHQLLSGPAGQ
jgi:hypothetical protein